MWDPKEVGGNPLDQRTGRGYEANAQDDKENFFEVRNLEGTHGLLPDVHQQGRKGTLPGEFSCVAIQQPDFCYWALMGCKSLIMDLTRPKVTTASALEVADRFSDEPLVAG